SDEPGREKVCAQRRRPRGIAQGDPVDAEEKALLDSSVAGQRWSWGSAGCGRPDWVAGFSGASWSPKARRNAVLDSIIVSNAFRLTDTSVVGSAAMALNGQRAPSTSS